MPGYTVNPFVDGFQETPAGPVPRVKTSLGPADHLGTIRARTGIAGNQYKINPGLYCAGNPSSHSPVLVTANYKLSFDSLRKELSNLDAWILVADTRGINVWCAAGKKTFSADEIALQVKRAKLSAIVSHRQLILPQFAAIGVAAHTLQKKCGFNGVFGPLRAADIPRFMKNGRQADEPMRTVTFTVTERSLLVPVEICMLWKVFFLVVPGLFILSGIGPDIFSFKACVERGLTAVGATVTAILAGSMLTPILLPWIPGRQFWLKGLLTGGVMGLAFIFLVNDQAGVMEKGSLWLWVVAIASYTGMNFTGATPFTSLSGVEKEMQRGLPVQFGGALLAIVLWIVAPFVN